MKYWAFSLLFESTGVYADSSISHKVKLTSVPLDSCLAEDGSVRSRVNSPELAPLPVNLES
jgi:hypothetical protein